VADDTQENRHERRVKKFASKDLPYSLDSAKLLDMVPELDRERGLGRVLREVIEATQGNFDHLRSENKRQTDYHNEHAEETNFIKDQTVPHEHPSIGPFLSPGHDRWHQMQAFSGIKDAAFTSTSVAYAMPAYIDKPCTITALRYQVQTAGTAQLRLGIYAGDNESNYPGSLLIDAGVTTPVDSSTIETAPFECDVPVGWIWLVIMEDTVAGTGSTLWEYNAGEAEATSQATWWPFPFDTDLLDEGIAGIAISFTLQAASRDEPWPAWAGELDNDDILYSSIAPIIDFKVT
jgi:hypothetical protein